MSRHLWHDIDRFQKKLLGLSAVVERHVVDAARAFTERDLNLARKVIGSDAEVDLMEVELEEEALKILALYQPVAVDLRVVTASLKINHDIERIGDLAVNIAKKAVSLSRNWNAVPVIDFKPMAQKVISMLRASLDALVDLDEKKARAVCASDEEVDAMNRDLTGRIKAWFSSGGSMDVDALLAVIAVPRHLERIADHATNIAEDVVYLVKGEIVRHRLDNGGEKTSPGAGPA